MRVLLLTLILPAVIFGQEPLENISVFNGRIQLLKPKILTPMSAEMMQFKYRFKTPPEFILSDAEGFVNLAARDTHQQWSADSLLSYTNFQLAAIQKSRSDVELIDHGLKQMSGHPVSFIKFITQALDTKIFNYYFFVVATDGDVLFFTFNCKVALRPKWETVADAIVGSLHVN